MNVSDDPQPDWYLREWAAAKGKRQADLVKELGWLKNAAHRIWHGKQPYRRDLLNEVARWLGIRPYELLMHPDESNALRRLRATAVMIVAESANEFVRDAPPVEKPKRTGTR